MNEEWLRFIERRQAVITNAERLIEKNDVEGITAFLQFLPKATCRDVIAHMRRIADDEA